MQSASSSCAQIFYVLNYLHNFKIAHLDIRVRLEGGEGGGSVERGEGVWREGREGGGGRGGFIEWMM